MMRRSLPTVARRAAISSGVAVVIAAAAVVGPVATAAQAAAVNTQAQLNKLITQQTGSAPDSAQDELPSPPRPASTRPAQRVVVKSTAAARARTASVMSVGTAKATTATKATAKAIGKSGAGAPGAGSGKTLVLYDSTGPYGWLGEVYGIQTVNLVSHFNAWTAHPVGQYTAGELNSYTSVIYVGSTYDEPIPAAFLTDVTATTKPVMWMYDNIWQLTASDPTFVAKRGFTWKQFDTSTVSEVDYKGTAMTRDTLNQGGIMDDVVSDPTRASVVATSVRADGTTFPWAVRSGNFTYVGEIPYSYVTMDDRYIAFSDMLFDTLAPNTATRHRALVRIEDVGPDADPTELRAVTNYLYSKKVPFTVAVYPRYVDPNGTYNNGKAQDYTLASKPKVVTELKYMQTHGGTLIMHGYTHQYGKVADPYDGVSADDFEFYMAHIDAANNVVYDGPVKEDSTTYASGRVLSGALTFMSAGLATPTIFEPPHYAASAVDYSVFNSLFGKRYDRGLYFPGVLSGGTVDYTKADGQFFPYTVRDVYGSAVVPEDIGNVEPLPFNNHPPRLPADILASAKRNLVVRDGTASFFYHPYLGTSYLQQLVPAIQQMGYTFVTANSMLGK